MDNLLFGATTMFFRDQPVTKALEHIAGHGYAAAEVWIEHLDESSESPAAVAARARSLELILTAHAASYDLNPTSTNSGIARESRRQIAASIAVAAELEARVLVVHPGRRTSSRDEAERFWPRLLDWALEVDALAAEFGVLVGFELMEKRSKEIFMTPDDASRLMQAPLQSSGLTIDVAHMNTIGNPLHFLERIDPDWVVHVHLSDNSPQRTHLPLGKGEIDLPSVLKAIAGMYSGIVNLEGHVLEQAGRVLAQNTAYLHNVSFARAR